MRNDGLITVPVPSLPGVIAPQSKRDDHIDALRGFALFGILTGVFFSFCTTMAWASAKPLAGRTWRRHVYGRAASTDRPVI